MIVDTFWLAIATLLATFVGPIAAVLITRWGDERRERQSRQLTVFRLLMANRRSQLSSEFVIGLNLVEVEFHEDKAVILSLKALFQNYYTPWPSIKKEQDHLYAAQQDLVALLLDSIAKTVGIRVNQLDIFRGGYFPTYLANLGENQARTWEFFANVSRHEAALPVIDVSQSGPKQSPTAP